MPADGLPPAGTPVPGDAAAPLTEHDTGHAGTAVGAPADDGATTADAAVPGDGMGGVGLVAKLRAVLRVKDFRKLWLSMSLSR